jgi:rRNA maturation RNase YbeY
MVKTYTGTRHKINKKEIIDHTQAFLTKRGIPDMLVNIIFVGKTKMKEIANTYKHEDVALPVLSFTYKETNAQNTGPEEENLLGEVFICYPQAILLAAEREKGVEQTLLQLIEHGVDNLLK